VAAKILGLKLILVGLINMAFIPIIQAVDKTFEQSDMPSDIVFWVFMVALFLPEMAFIVSRDFRMWLKSGVENNDGILDKSDLKDIPTHVGAYYCAKVFTLVVVADIFYTIDVSDTVLYLCFSGFAGTETVLQMARIFKK